MSERDPLEGLYEVAPATAFGRIENLILRAFAGDSEGRVCAKACKRPVAFNLLLGWVPGDERWPVAALLLRRGLTIRGSDEFTYDAIAKIVDRSSSSVNTVLGSKGMKSVYRRIVTAWELMGKEPRRNELRFDLGLPTGIWVPLAKSGILTVDSLRSAVEDGSLRSRVDGCGRLMRARVAAALENHCG